MVFPFLYPLPDLVKMGDNFHELIFFKSIYLRYNGLENKLDKE